MSLNHAFNFHFKRRHISRHFCQSLKLRVILSSTSPNLFSLYTLEVRTRSLSLIMPDFHHTFADIFKTWNLSFCPEKITATPHLVQQHQQWFTPARPPAHVIYSSVFMFYDGATLADSVHQAAIRINDAVSRPEPISDSDQTSTVSHLWLLLLPYQA